MSFFNHVELHKYDLTDKQLDILADHMREEFKDYMRPLFA